MPYTGKFDVHSIDNEKEAIEVVCVFYMHVIFCSFVVESD